ncbi:hypothetical protein BRD01_09520 [Halobacteriales archaeon QS_8_65_32]|jgi:hypothetical protein|nr:MAG: hypothetical protein BRD01_09520 [Halobacteriales archaeon QS_8_65_32]
MSERQWTDRIVGDRMAVDREFNDRIAASQFSRQEWGLVMTATEFEIESPEDADRARLVADTENLPAVVPELDRISSQAGAMGAGGEGAGGAGGGSGGGRSSSGDGVFGSIKSALGLGGSEGADDETIEAADRLAQEYAAELQRRLEDRGKWAEIRELASEQPMNGTNETDGTVGSQGGEEG